MPRVCSLATIMNHMQYLGFIPKRGALSFVHFILMLSVATWFAEVSRMRSSSPWVRGYSRFCSMT